ncbi:MAG: hypothetical protein ACIAQZ_12330 [Sedimentisphaeraceae bacterium JB056]
MNQTPAKITELPIDDVVSILKKCGSKNISKKLVSEYIKQGLPVNNDKVNLLEFAAWLVKEVANGN